MGPIRKLFRKMARFVVDKAMGNGLMQEETQASGASSVPPAMSALLREAAADGIVLLKNDGTLPLRRGARVAVFGRCQFDYFYVGYGSGGDVHPPYKVSPAEAIAEAVADGRLVQNADLLQAYRRWRAEPDNAPDDGWWGHWPLHYPEMPVSRVLAESAARESEVALVILGRAAGEDRENKLEKGSYYLTDEERALLDTVTAAFRRTVVVLDCGNIVDLSLLCRYGDKLSALVYAWQGGMESGHALVDVLTGAVAPSGKLADTIAVRYGDYPSALSFGGKHFNNYEEDIYVGYRYFESFARDRVLFPFGFGLTYTSFSLETESFRHDGGTFSVAVRVRNTGRAAGREVVQLYVQPPQGGLGKPSRVLAAFSKTPLLQPEESCLLLLTCTEYDIASFDDTGAGGSRGSYLLEAGDYVFYLGTDARSARPAGRYILPDTEELVTLRPVCPVREPFLRIVNKNGKAVREPVPALSVDLRERILSELPPAVGYAGEQGIRLLDVKEGRAPLEAFLSQLTDAELEALTRGYGCMGAPFGVSGNAGAYGGILPSLAEKGIPSVVTTDGPAGIRVNRYAALLPCGTALACTWDPALVERVYAAVGEEMSRLGSDVLLAPGMNIHRDPLCGRNFEYFSEDPLLTGKMAAAAVRGVQSRGHIACPKHFACNNQERGRNRHDSRVSERALREIYWKGFEICVREGKPYNIMTSYNKINGVWSHYNYDLVTTVLRGEWGFGGAVVTDWWMRRSASPEFPALADNAYRVRAQVDVLMPGNMSYLGKKYKSDGTLLRTLGKAGGITRGELERSAANTLRVAMLLL